MDCPACGLHNIPGAAACFQCRADLSAPAGERPADFYPTRARKGGLARGNERKRAERSLSDIRIERWFDSALAPAYVYGRHLRRGFLSLLPGLAQVRNREPGKARWFFLAAVASLAGSILLIRHGWSNALFLTFLSIQLSAVADGAISSVRRESKEPPGPAVQMGLMLVISSVFFAAWLLVAGAGGELAIRLSLPGRAGRFEAGDRLFALRDRVVPRPGRGEWWVAELQGLLRANEDWNERDQLGGDSVERIVATPGSRIVAGGGSFVVDGLPFGEAVAWREDVTELVVPEDTVLSIRYRFVNRVLDRSAGLTRLTELRGRIVAVTSPPERRSFVGRER